jgi:hypothetical protein
MSSGNIPPINITDVLPAQSPQGSIIASSAGTPASIPALNPIPANSPDIPGLRDVTVKGYSNWQQSKVDDEMIKVEFQKACDMALEDDPDLEQVYKDQDPDLFVKQGVEKGIARRYWNLSAIPSNSEVHL